MTVVHIAVLLFIIVAGLTRAKTSNLTPFAPHGARGIFSGAAYVYFTFTGFDAVATSAEEVLPPSADFLFESKAYLEQNRFVTITASDTRTIHLILLALHVVLGKCLALLQLVSLQMRAKAAKVSLPAGAWQGGASSASCAV